MGDGVAADDGSIALGDLTELDDGEMRCFEDVGPDGIVVCRVDGELYALTDNCSHADTPLSEGRLRGHHLTCPLHGSAFDVRDGSHSGPPAWEGVACHRVIEADGVAVVVLASSDERRDEPPAGGAGLRTR